MEGADNVVQRVSSVDGVDHQRHVLCHEVEQEITRCCAEEEKDTQGTAFAANEHLVAE